jgi:transposase-like protein
MSDRQKGIVAAVAEVLPDIQHSYCAQHIAANVQSAYGIAARKLFWPCAYAITKEDYNTALAALMAENRHAGIYVRNIKPETYAYWAFPASRFGHLTSNIIESLNGAWKLVQALTPLRMLIAIW